jgi:hypothetical protein
VRRAIEHFRGGLIGLIFYWLLVWAGLAVALAVVSGWVQGYFYEQPLERLGWRSFAGGTVLAVLLALGAGLAARWPDRFDSAFTLSPYQIRQLEQFWSEKKGDTGTGETLFRRRVVPPGRVEYVDADGRRWQRSDSGIVTAIIIEEDEGRRRFAARLGPDETFPVDPRDPNRTLPVQYVEEGGRGRVMSETDMGTLSTPRYGVFFVNTLLNLLYLAAWVAVLIFVLGYQPGHAIGIGVIGWAVVLLIVWPPLKGMVR